MPVMDGTQMIRALRVAAKLREVVGQVNTAAQNMAADSQELSSSAEQLSQGSTEQAALTEEASASMEEMAANVKQNAENASTTAKLASRSATDAEASGPAVGNLTPGFGQMRDEARGLTREDGLDAAHFAALDQSMRDALAAMRHTGDRLGAVLKLGSGPGK